MPITGFRNTQCISQDQFQFHGKFYSTKAMGGSLDSDTVYPCSSEQVDIEYGTTCHWLRENVS